MVFPPAVTWYSFPSFAIILSALTEIFGGLITFVLIVGVFRYLTPLNPKIANEREAVTIPPTILSGEDFGSIAVPTPWSPTPAITGDEKAIFVTAVGSDPIA